MSKGERAADGRMYLGWRPDELAALAVAHAAEHGFRLELRPDTPVVVGELFRHLPLASGTWGEIEPLLRRWADVGCTWVNLRFAIEDGRALVRVEGRADGEPLEGLLPACNGGFDCAPA